MLNKFEKRGIMEKKYLLKTKENKNVKNYIFYVIYDTRKKRTLK